jgi:hypothetical protein
MSAQSTPPAASENLDVLLFSVLAVQEHDGRMTEMAKMCK